MVNLNTGSTQDIAGATQTEFAGTPEQTFTEVDPYSGVPLVDPVTGEYVIDPDTGDYVIDPGTIETYTYTIPAQPAVYSGIKGIMMCKFWLARCCYKAELLKWRRVKGKLWQRH